MVFPQLVQYSDFGWLFLRLAVGLIFIYHGWPKIKNYKQMTMLPGGVIGALVLGLVESLSAIGLIIGFYTQIAALLLSIVMLGAIYYKIFVWKKKFSEPGGWEIDLILLAANLVILFR